MQIQLTTGYQLAFLRWFSSIVPVGTTIPLGGVTGDLADWEFEGTLNDSSGHGLNMKTGGVSFAATQAYAPFCNPGPQQVFRAGVPATLDATGSQALDGTTNLTYLWQYVAPTEVGAPRQRLVWSSHTTQRTTISGMVFGPVNIQLTVTDSSGQFTTCTVHHGAVPTDANGNVVIADPKVNVLLGPMTRMDRSCDLTACTSSALNPWPWADQLQFAWAKHMGAAQGTAPIGTASFIKTWETRTNPGTISINNGSATVTGSSTTFGNTFCGSSASFPCTPPTNNVIIIWYCTSGSAPACFDSLATSGRRYYVLGANSITSQTSLTIQAGPSSVWHLANCSGCYYSAWTLNDQGSWGGQSTNNNYYDDVKAFYATYYRTGIEDNLTWARWLADAWYNSPILDQLTCGNEQYQCPAPRIQSVEGIVLRALDEDAAAGSSGSSPKWAGLRKNFDLVVQHVGLAQTVPIGTSSDLREESYDLAVAALCAITDPNDVARVTNCLSVGDQALTARWGPQRHSDGSWVGIYCTQFCSTDGSQGTISATNGLNTVTLSGNTWSTGNFCNAGTTAYIYMSTLNGMPYPPFPTNDTRGYKATRTGATTATLDANYVGTTGSGKAFFLSCGGGTNDWAGPLIQPFMLGITSNAFRLWAYALIKAGANPPYDSATAGVINTTWLPGIATWLGTTAVNTDTISGVLYRGPYYGVGGTVCGAPYGPLGNPGDCYGAGTVQESRELSPELVAAISTGYCLTGSPNLLAYGDNYYSSMFAKFPSNAGYDGGWIADMDINGFFWNLLAGKWWGFFWGYGRTQSWVSARQGCVSAPINRTLNVGFNLASIPNATQVRVTLTKPDGTSVTNTCTSSPCAVIADAREGSHLVTLTYLSAGGSVLAISSEPEVVDVN